MWFGLLALLSLGTSCLVVMADDLPVIDAPSSPVITLASEPVSDLTLLLSPSGEPLVAWLTRDDSDAPLLAVARGPGWQVERHVGQGPGQAVRALGGSWEEQPLLWWLQSDEQQDWALVWDGATGALQPPRAVPQDAVPVAKPSVLTDSFAWLADGALWMVDASGAERLVLADVDGADGLVAHEAEGGLLWAWRGTDGAVYLLDETQSSSPVQLSPAGSRPEIVCHTGGCGCAWLQEDQVWVATSSAWDAPQATGARPTQEAGWAVAMDADGQLHLVWVEDGVLWHAHGGDWASSRHQIAGGVTAGAIALAMDPWGGLHAAWTELAEDGATSLRYLRWRPDSAQARVVGPGAGEYVRGSTTVFLETSLAPSDVECVSLFLEAHPSADRAVGGALLPLETAWSPLSGWSATVDGAIHGAAFPQRVVARVRQADGAVRWAWGEWFSLARADAPLLWVEDDARVVAYLPASVDPLPDRLDIYLEPKLAAADPSESFPYPPNDVVQTFVGSVFPESVGRYRVDLPLAALSDGAYVVRVWVQAGGQRFLVPAAPEVLIRRSGLPSIHVEVPATAASARDELTYVAVADDMDGMVTQVSFHLVSPPDAASTRSIWLGTDTDGSDGWSVRARGAEAGWWYVRAEAIDDKGNRNVALSDAAMQLTSPAVPYAEFITPHDGSVVRGVKTVRLAVETDSPAVERTTLMVAPEGGEFEILGALVAEAGELRFAWNTSQWIDGPYRLAALLEFVGGRTSFVETEALVVNDPPALRFVSPRADDILEGWQTVQLAPSLTGGDVQAVDVYLRDASGELFAIGPARRQDKAWVATWSTCAYLDGAYDLVAYLHGERIQRVEVPVRLANLVPDLRVTVSQHEDGLAELAWAPSDDDLDPEEPWSVSLAYSPHKGWAWLPIAAELPVSGTMALETADLPDSRDGLLRIQLYQGARPTVSVTRRLVVNNVNEPPLVRWLTPEPGDRLDGSATIAWESLGADAAGWQASLSYRQDDQAWEPLADGLDASGRHLWDLSELPPGDGYALKLTLADGAGDEVETMVEGLTVAANAPPRVRLIAPGSSTVFQDEVGLLWEATDPDGDPLRVTVDYSHDAGMTWLPVAEDIPDTGYLEWYVAYLPPGRSYRVRVTVTDGLRVAQAASGTFGIGPAPALNVALEDPVVGDRVAGHTVVRWRTDALRAHLLSASVFVRRVGESNWLTLAANIPNDGHFFWDTTGLRDGHYELRVTVTDATRTSRAEVVTKVEVANQGCPAIWLELDSDEPAVAWTGQRELIWRLGLWESDPMTGTLLYRQVGAYEWEALTSFDPLKGRLVVDARQLDGVAMAELALSVASMCDVAQVGLGPAVRLGHYQGSPPVAELDLLRGHELSPDDHLLAWRADSEGGRPLVADLWSSRDGLAVESLLAGMAPRGTYWLTSDDVRDLEGAGVGLTASDGVLRTRTVMASSDALGPFKQALPAVNLLSPAASHPVSGTVAVEWLALPEHPDAAVTISASTNGGAEWRRLVTVSASEGSYAWDTTRLANGPCLLKVSLEQEGWQPGDLVVPLEIANEGGHAPMVMLTLPTEDVPWSGPRRVTWASHDPDGDDLTLNLAYSVNDGQSWYVIARGLEDTGSYLLDTSVLPNAERIHLRLTASDGLYRTSAVSGSSVAVRDPGRPWITLLAPRAFQDCAGLQEIRWHGIDPAARETVSVRIELSDDRGTTWQELRDGLDLAGSLLWDTSGLAHGAATWLRATMVDGDGTIEALATLPGPVYISGSTPPTRCRWACPSKQDTPRSRARGIQTAANQAFLGTGCMARRA